MKLRIVEPGFAGYTGMFGVVEFKDGVSIDHVNHVERNLLKAIVRFEEFDDSSSVAEQASESQSEVSIVQIQDSSHPTQDHAPAHVAENTVVKRHTREELEKIADENGIAGLREIGDPLGVKATSIAKLIEELLVAAGPIIPAVPVEETKA